MNCSTPRLPLLTLLAAPLFPGPLFAGPAAFAVQNSLEATQLSEMRSTGSGASIGFGRALANSGTDLAVSTRGSAGAALAPRVLLYERHGEAWALAENLFGDGHATSDFGAEIALADDILAVADPGRDTTLGKYGQIHLYEKDSISGSFTPLQVIPAGFASSSQIFFAEHLDFDGETLAASFRNGQAGTIPSHAGTVLLRRRSTGFPALGTVILSAAAPQAEARFGSKISVDGNTIAVASILHDGTSFTDAGLVSIFERPVSSSDVWTLAATLAPPHPVASGHFGEGLQLTGDRLLVGQPGTGLGAPGRAYVYRRNSGAWALEAELLCPDGQAADRYGATVDLRVDSGTVLAFVGAPTHDGNGPDNGAGYVFRFALGSWSHEQRLDLPQPSSAAQFGSGVELTDSEILVSARFDSLEDVVGGPGSLNVFALEKAVWQRTLELRCPDEAADSFYGVSVSMDTSTIAVGSLFQPGPSPGASGLVDIFDRKDSARRLSQRITSPAGVVAGDEFGAAVAVAGDVLVIGAPKDTNPAFECGSFNIYRRIQGLYELYIVGFGRNDFAWAGSALDMDETHLVVGAPQDAKPGEPSSGTVRVLKRSPNSWILQSELTPPNPQTLDLFGASLDLDWPYLLVGAPGRHSPLADSGEAFLYELDEVGGHTLLHSFVPNFSFANDEFGSAVAYDGRRVAIGAERRNAGQPQSGVAFTFLESNGSWNQEAFLTDPDPQFSGLFGSQVALRGGTLFISAPLSVVPAEAEAVGVVHAYSHAGSSGWLSQGVIAAGDRSFDLYGAALAFDGTELVIGSPGSDSHTLDFVGHAELLRIDNPGTFEFCFGDGGDENGCTTCPCGNDAPPGTHGGCLNSSGRSARVLLSGRPSVSEDGLRFELQGATPQTFSTLTSGNAAAPGNPINPCFGLDAGLSTTFFDGLRCVVMQTRRQGSRATDSLGRVGANSPGWGPPDNPAGGLLAINAFVAGQTLYWYCTYRDDPSLVCGTGLNTTQGISTTFLP